MPGTLYAIHKIDSKGVVVLMGEPRICDREGVVEGNDEAAESSPIERPTRHVATQTPGAQLVSRATSPLPPPLTTETSDAGTQTKRIETTSHGTSPDPAESLSSLVLEDSRRPSPAEPAARDTTPVPAVGPWWDPPGPASSEPLQNVSITPASAAVPPEDPNTQTSLSRGGPDETRPSKKKAKKSKKKKKTKKAKDGIASAPSSSNSAAENTGLDQGAVLHSGDKQSNAETVANSADGSAEGKDQSQEEEQKEVPQTLWARARAYSASWLFRQ